MTEKGPLPALRVGGGVGPPPGLPSEFHQVKIEHPTDASQPPEVPYHRRGYAAGELPGHGTALHGMQTVIGFVQQPSTVAAQPAMHAAQAI